MKGIIFTLAFTALLQAKDAHQLMDKYSSADFSGKTLAVIPSIGAPRVVYNGDVTDEFGKGNKEILIRQYYGKSIVEEIRKQSKFANVSYKIDRKSLQFDSTKLKVGRIRKSVFKMPKKGSQVALENGIPDVVLIIQDVSITTGTTVRAADDIHRSIEFEGLYLFWDNKSEEIIAYGYASYIARTTVPSITIAEWETATFGFADYMLYWSNMSKREKQQ